MSTATPYKVSVRLGQAEFSAEGPEDTVREQLAHFFIAATQPLPIHVTAAKNGGASNGHGDDGTHVTPPAAADRTAPTAAAVATAVPPEVVARLFKEDQNGFLSLRTLPKTERRNADALLLLMWGYLIRKSQDEVRARELIAGMRQSGVTNLNRVDETLEKYDQLVTSGGVRAGKWYRLTNPGIETAEGMAASIFG
jgi:hypothetical protein